MKITKILEKGNCGSVNDRGEEACIKAVSPRTGTAYKAGSPGEEEGLTLRRRYGPWRTCQHFKLNFAMPLKYFTSKHGLIVLS